MLSLANAGGTIWSDYDYKISMQPETGLLCLGIASQAGFQPLHKAYEAVREMAVSG